MSFPITKKTLEHLAYLARIKLTPGEEKKLLGDLQKILDYFQELQELPVAASRDIPNTAYVKNVFRQDESRENTNHRQGTEAFPEEKDGFLKVPEVFENEE